VNNRSISVFPVFEIHRLGANIFFQLTDFLIWTVTQ
jgi:hypothetical protein